ncbi:MAG TPA: saccharopine dehydrogenase [Mycobacteriales bacterium]|jgi:saccharopine dehydrogenase (NAD+, L-lysine-forming)|nr:saccharopine dehydrogenase [Mycobacteriales bacterium]
MADSLHLWLRQEASAVEERAPVVPGDAAALVGSGIAVTVEEAPQRAFAAQEYAAAGCRIVPAGSWPDAPPDTVVIGLKEPSAQTWPLRHRHVFFGHAYKGQAGGRDALRRFVAGGGTLLDLEAMVDDSGRRVVAFGYWAGYAGAALAVLQHRGALDRPLRSTSRDELDARLRGPSGPGRALVIGALGRSGRGALEALQVAGMPATAWDVEETRTLDHDALLGHDILINTIVADRPGPPFLTHADLDRAGRTLRTVSDVTNDVTSDANRLPVNDKVTTWAEPVRRLHREPPVLDMVAIDNLPSLLPRESSTTFSGDLTPYLRGLPDDPVWVRCRAAFEEAVARQDATDD